MVVSGLGLLVATRPYRRSRDGHPLWIAGLPTPDSWRSLRQATSPQLLHHHPGRDRSGYDLYKNGAALAISNMAYYGLPAFAGDAFLSSILRDFQVMMISRRKQSYDRPCLKYNSSEHEVKGDPNPLCQFGQPS